MFHNLSGTILLSASMCKAQCMSKSVRRELAPVPSRCYLWRTLEVRPKFAVRGSLSLYHSGLGPFGETQWRRLSVHGRKNCLWLVLTVASEEPPHQLSNHYTSGLYSKETQQEKSPDWFLKRILNYDHQWMDQQVQAQPAIPEVYLDPCRQVQFHRIRLQATSFQDPIRDSWSDPGSGDTLPLASPTVPGVWQEN